MLHPSEVLPPATAPLVRPDELPGWVLFQDDHLLVVDKPGWLVVHPSKQGPWSSLAGAVREGLGIQTIRFINRLDRETSGVVILAKSDDMSRRLQKAMNRRLVRKLYLTILEGELAGVTEVKAPLGPDPTANVTVRQRVVDAGSPGAQECATIFHPLAARDGWTVAGVELLTGRKHQIRAHAEHIGHRVAGDKLYGPDPTLYLEFAERGWTERHSALLPLTRQALHCVAIDFRPARIDVSFRSPWPADLARFAARALRLEAADAQALIDGFVGAVLERPVPPAADTPPPLSAG